ncbi:hypothetical protein [Paenibacillus terrae]|uniref:Uncharacterized protein n=1 Tax=Paenibacillus terrae TaxID=159743 RepID=A0A0D7X3R8_9BACL|nr:hypothetical protein [Paenibacillus terrae]KJD45623.1 hypothetical protein QD47_10630 [Paenibacillus terrae]
MKLKAGAAGRHIRLVYGANGHFMALGSISLETFRKVRKKLVRNTTFKDLRDLRAGISSQVKFSLQLTMIIAITSFIITFAISPMTFYLQQSSKTNDWTHEYLVLIHKEKLQEIESITGKEDYLKDALENERTSYITELSKLQRVHIRAISLVIVPIMLIFSTLIYRNKWLYCVEQCVNEAFEEKKELLEKKKERREKELQSRKDTHLIN